MLLAQIFSNSLSTPLPGSSRAPSGQCSPAERVAAGSRKNYTHWALPEHGRRFRIQAHKSGSDGSEGPSHKKSDEKERRRRISPEEAKLAQENIKKALTVERLLKSATISPGLTGSLAVLGGFWLHINPYGNLHWNSEDLLVGMTCILPLLLLDAAVMLPDHQKHSAKYIEQTASRFANARAKYEAAKASSAGSGSDVGEQASSSTQEDPREGSTQRLPEPMRSAAAFEGGEPEASFSGGSSSAAVRLPRLTRTPVQHLRVSAQYIQSMLLQRGSKTALLPLPVDVGLTAAAKLGSCMLEFAVILTGLSYWERDRMYELGFQDMVEVLGRSMPLQEAGQWAALAALVAGLLGLAASLQAAQAKTTAQQRVALLKQSGKARQGLEFQLFQRNLKNSGALDPGAIAAQLQSSLETSASAHKSLSAMLDSAKQEKNAQDRWNAAVVTLREIVGLWGVGASFIFTGNLLAPWAAATATGVLRSAYSRVQLPRLRKRRMELLGKLKASLGDDAKVSQDVMRQAGIPVSAKDTHSVVSETEGEAQGKKEGDTEE